MTEAPLACAIDQNSMTVGEKHTLTCNVTGFATKPSDVLIFSNLDTKNPYDISFLGSPQVNGSAIVQTFTSYKVGRHNQFSVQLAVNGQVMLVQVPPFEVKTVIPQSATANPSANSSPAGQPEQSPAQTQVQATPYPLVDPLVVPAPWWWWALWGVFIAAIIAFVIRQLVLWKRERLRIEVEKKTTPQTPHQKFLASLRKLESKEYHLKGNYKTFALELTNLVKTAFSDQFKFPAIDMTSEELTEVLEKKHRGFYSQTGERLKNLFQELDQIKFAKTQTTPERCVGLLDATSQVGQVLFGGMP